jgi:hypothetical protein
MRVTNFRRKFTIVYTPYCPFAPQGLEPDRLTKRDVDIILSFQVAWWGHVFSDLRLVSLRWTERTAELFFYVNGPIIMAPEIRTTFERFLG